MQGLVMQGMQQKHKSHIFDIEEHALNLSNLTIFYNLQRMWLWSLIGLAIKNN